MKTLTGETHQAALEISRRIQQQLTTSLNLN
jgi:hypothetical protein